jgi:ferrous iron transport protein B
VEKKELKAVLVGNPNSGKTSVFNQLTGLNQKVGNFPGVTVDKKTGRFNTSAGETVLLTDLPGLYSIYPNAQDEQIAASYILQAAKEKNVDVFLFVADSTRLENHLLLFSQLRDLGLPLILLLNMEDEARKNEISIDADALRAWLGSPAIFFNGRSGKGKEKLFDLLSSGFEVAASPLTDIVAKVYAEMAQQDYQEIANMQQTAQSTDSDSRAENNRKQLLRLQIEETILRLNYLRANLKTFVTVSQKQQQSTLKWDHTLTHPVLGPLLFFGFMFLVFQAIFSWASYPMDFIEETFAMSSAWLSERLPDSWWSNLLTEGLLAGLAGIAVFVPQIAILFFLLSLLEESGYMARMVYMFDSFMQRFGLNGRSLISLVSGGACAIPAIMSARTISNWKERIITIMVTPLISCSARIPIYTVMIGLLIPAEANWGPFNLQGIMFMGLYLAGIVAAFAMALLMKKLLKDSEPGYLALDLPSYRMPLLKNVFLTVKEKVGAFVWEAGRVIIVIAMILWGLASYGPSGSMEKAAQQSAVLAQELALDEDAAGQLEASLQLEASYAGIFGKWIEPSIAPLGFDWKIGIALLTSFAAREVFIGTMATIYAVGSDDEAGIRQRMAEAIDPRTGKKVYTAATTLSLLVFYIFAMQCMSTLAIVKRETNSYKWPMIQFFAYTALAWVLSLMTYQVAILF